MAAPVVDGALETVLPVGCAVVAAAVPAGVGAAAVLPAGVGFAVVAGALADVVTVPGRTDTALLRQAVGTGRHWKFGTTFGWMDANPP